jgi:phage/plasmid-like protein (TIGR03299 family)
MSHQIETMAYKGTTPWHGLGNALPAHQPIEIWAQQAGMNWEIKQSPVRFITGQNDYLGEIKSFEDKKVLYRSDTNTALSVVGNRYKVVQPREILEFYRDLTEQAGFELETAGVLKEGKKIWALARTGQSGSLRGNDVSNGYVLLATACDGSMATTAQFTSIRVVCNNTLAVALKSGLGIVKVPHSTVFDAQKVKKELGISISAWDNFMYEMKTLSERRVKTSEVNTFINNVFNDPKAANNTGVNERAKNKVLNLFNGHGKGADLLSSKNTAFGLLNAVTEFVDHERKARNTDYRLDSAWFGQGALIKEKALSKAMLLLA